MIGKMVSHYKILERFTRPKGEVYLAEDTRFDRKVVLKMFAEMSDPSREREAFEREAMVASLADHPNIRAVFGTDEYEGHPFIVMEHMEGTPLETRLSKQTLEVDQILEVGLQIAGALDAIHSKGIIHRNISSANIFLTVEGQAKLCDFNAATKVGAQKAREPDQQLVGTQVNPSPEQLRGEPVDTGTDIFSFGAVIYEMLTGVRPFQKETAEATANAVLRKKPTRISKYRRKVPRLLKKTVAELLVKNPARRLLSARELRIRLEEVQNQLSHKRGKLRHWIGVGILILWMAVVATLYFL